MSNDIQRSWVSTLSMLILLSSACGGVAEDQILAGNETPPGPMVTETATPVGTEMPRADGTPKPLGPDETSDVGVVLPSSTTSTSPSSISINFQPANLPVPVGMLSDSGEIFGNRGNGYSYGWNVSHAVRMTYYPPPLSGLNAKYWTLAQFAPEAHTTWEIALPNGSYDVQVVAGGPVASGGMQRVSVEGQPIVDAHPGDYNPWAAGKLTVSVDDGKLTMHNTAGADTPRNTICYLIIGPQAIEPPDTQPTAID